MISCPLRRMLRILSRVCLVLHALFFAGYRVMEGRSDPDARGRREYSDGGSDR